MLFLVMKMLFSEVLNSQVVRTSCAFKSNSLLSSEKKTQEILLNNDDFGVANSLEKK